MLKKLLKYDFKYVLRYWWIAALTSFVLSFAGGICLRAMTSERALPPITYPFIVIAFILVIFSYVAFSILSVIFVYTRFYKNFFTDEGYLTFTLPVKRSQLLNSKLIMSVVTISLTSIVCIINLFVLFAVGLWEEIFIPEFWLGLKEGWNVITKAVGLFLLVYAIEAIAFLILSVTFSCLFIFCCITFASIITKKAKVITAIGIYYVANGMLSFIIQMFSMFGIASISTWISALPKASQPGMVAFILLGMICFAGIFCALLYTLQYWMLDRKLNLN